MVSWKSTESWGTTAMFFLRLSSWTVLIPLPPILMSPESGSKNLNTGQDVRKRLQD